MIIDAHAHLDVLDSTGWGDSPEKLLHLMDRADIDKTVVTSYGDTPGPNPSIDRLREYVSAHPDRFLGFPRLDPRYGDEATDAFERAITEDGMRGLKLHPVSYGAPLFGEQTLRLLDMAADFDVPVLIHSGDRLGALPQQVAEAARHTDATLLMGHIGGFFNAREALEAARRHENIVLETSAFPYPRVIQDAVDELGAERVVYGSDMPPGNPIVELEKISVLDLTESQRERILWRNTAEMLDVEMEGSA
jgi:hypothetical protein